jgi:hypothetical protein
MRLESISRRRLLVWGRKRPPERVKSRRRHGRASIMLAGPANWANRPAFSRGRIPCRGPHTKTTRPSSSAPVSCRARINHAAEQDRGLRLERAARHRAASFSLAMEASTRAPQAGRLCFCCWQQVQLAAGDTQMARRSRRADQTRHGVNCPKPSIRIGQTYNFIKSRRRRRSDQRAGRAVCSDGPDDATQSDTTERGNCGKLHSNGLAGWRPRRPPGDADRFRLREPCVQSGPARPSCPSRSNLI